jgi:hypothetical protein
MKKTEGGKVLMRNTDLNEMDYTEVILSIDVRSSSSTVVFRINKGFKIRDYTFGKSALAWGNHKKKCDPVSAL